MERQVYLILGMTGNGKSTLARKISARYPRVVTLDPQHEHGGVIVTSIDEFVEEMERYYRSWTNAEFRVTCRFHTDGMSEDEEEEYYKKFLRVCYQLRDFLLVVEEADQFLDPQKKNKPFLRLIARGRHREISLLCIVRRMPEINKNLRAQCNSIVTFVQTEPDDLALLARYGFDPEAVSHLDPYCYLEVGDTPVQSVIEHGRP